MWNQKPRRPDSFLCSGLVRPLSRPLSPLVLCRLTSSVLTYESRNISQIQQRARAAFQFSLPAELTNADDPRVDEVDAAERI